MKKIIKYLLLVIITVNACGCFPFYKSRVMIKRPAPIIDKRNQDTNKDSNDNNSNNDNNSDKKNNNGTEKKSSKVYTSGITNIDDALHYEVGLFFYNGESTDVGMNPDVRVIKANTSYINASQLPEKMLTETVYAYFTDYKNDMRFDRGYTEEEVKKALEDLYGENYQYSHRLTQTSACTSLQYSNETGNYEMVGGCGGLVADYEPRIRIKVLEKTDTTVTIGRLYYVPSKGSDEFSATGPYSIYNNENKDKLIATINEEDDNLFETYKDQIDKYLITFDKESGYYHFNNLKKIN